MKKIFVSVGLVAVGAAGLPSANAQSMGASTAPKIWNVSGTLRGFYDDNYTVSHNKKGSAGFEVSPSVSANIDLQQTDIGIRYTYGMYYYQDREDNGSNPIDSTHRADLWVDHAFSESLKGNVTDSFVVAQDPKIVDGGAITRVGGNNVANRAKATIDKDWTRQFSTSTHYGNNLFIYSDTQGTNNVPTGVNPSQASILNRIEQKVGTDFQWHFQPETMGFVGYAFSWVRYTGDQKIAPDDSVTIPGKTIQYFSDARNYNAHYAYVGVQHEFTPSLTGQARGGVNDTDNYNDPAGSYNSWSPYADINLTYTYIPGSYVQAGFTQDINSTDVVQPNPGNGHLTAYQQSSVFYMDINHRFTPKITGSLVSQYQYSKYENGAYSGTTGDSDVSVGVNLTYQINQHFSANAGYNYDELFSDIAGRDYTRNRVYVGLGASY